MVGENKVHPSPDVVRWDKLEDTASEMFNVWVDGVELDWAKECWGHFIAGDLAGDATILERTATLLRLVTLARIYEEFCSRAWDENPDTPIVNMAEGLEIDPVALGILASRVSGDTFDDVFGDYELHEVALIAVTDAQRNEIFDCLCTAYGDSVRLYSRMYHTRYPVNDETEDDEFMVTGPNCVAIEYVMSGFIQ